MWVHGQVTYIQLHSPGVKERSGRGGRKIVRAREEAHDQMEIESYKLLGPCSYEPTAMVSACTRPMQTQADKTQHGNQEMGSRTQF